MMNCGLTDKDWLDIAIGIAAAFGAISAVLQWIRNYRNDKVHLRVIPYATYIENKPAIFVQVINLSVFDVTIAEVGLWENNKHCFRTEVYGGREHILPKLLKSRGSFGFNLVLNFVNNKEDLSKWKSVYAKTQCDTLCHGNKRVFKKTIRGFFKYMGKTISS